MTTYRVRHFYELL